MHCGLPATAHKVLTLPTTSLKFLNLATVGTAPTAHASCSTCRQTRTPLSMQEAVVRLVADLMHGCCLRGLRGALRRLHSFLQPASLVSAHIAKTLCKQLYMPHTLSRCCCQIRAATSAVLQCMCGKSRTLSTWVDMVYLLSSNHVAWAQPLPADCRCVCADPPAAHSLQGPRW